MKKEKEAVNAAEDKAALWDLNTLCANTHIKLETIRKFIFQKRIPFVKIGKLVRFRPGEIECWINNGGKVEQPKTVCLPFDSENDNA